MSPNPMQIRIFDAHDDGETRITCNAGNFICYGGSEACHEATVSALMKVKTDLESQGQSFTTGNPHDIAIQFINNLQLD